MTTTRPTIAAPGEHRGPAAGTLADLVLAAERRGAARALALAGGAEPWTYAELGLAAREIAGGLLALGVAQGERVALLAETRPEWTLCDAGALLAGAVVTPIYQTNAPEECAYVLDHAQARVVLCEDAAQAGKVAAVRDRCPALRHVVVMTGTAPGP